MQILSKFPIKKGLKKENALSLLPLKSALDYATRRVQVNQDGLKLNGTHPESICVDVNILGGIVHATKKNTVALVVASKKVGLERTADKTSHSICLENGMQDDVTILKLDKKPFQGVDLFKCFGATSMGENAIQEEITSGLKSGNACCHSVQNLLSSSFLSKNIKFDVFRT
jgi:hypothetical protein